MIKIVEKYKNLSFEQKTIAFTIFSLFFSALLAGGKFVIGLFTDYNLCVVAAYTAAILLAKLECVLGVRSGKRAAGKHNVMVFMLLLVSSVIYIGYNCRVFFVEREAGDYGLIYVELVAFIAFVELGFAIAGLFRTKNKGLFYRNIKIINLGVALIAILTTQITILDFTSVYPESVNAFSGIGVGCFIALSSVYILLAPILCVNGRERNIFIIKNGKMPGNEQKEIVLCKSRVYGSYVYRADIQNGRADGYIERMPSLWKNMPVWLKIICCILSEILIFIWLAGRIVFFFRAVNLPAKLERIMAKDGFVKLYSGN